MLVSVAVLAILVVLVAQLFSSAANMTGSTIKRINIESQSRPVLDRLAIDLAQMIKRADVDYFTKSPSLPLTGNDRIAFFSQVPGYGASSLSPISLVAYRINSKNRLERMGKALAWNGDTTTVLPLVFLPITISGNWPAATDSAADADYEVIAPNIFRFEYCYVLRNGSMTTTPWDTSVGHTTISGMQDVAAIYAAVATIDTKSKILLSDTQLSTLAGRLPDFTANSRPGDMLSQWQTVLNGTTDMPRAAISEIRLSERCFPIAPSF